ncbi:MAG: hypothetical protein PHD15_00010 [Clostridia bacterium]|nr:hypothetical protein [Clostridia bacterium]MDD4386136.1 hypothetical protein [Clostridia bacterium]
MNKLATSLITVMIILISISGIYATSSIGILDVEYTENVYKFSDNDDINLPFIRMSSARMIMDKDINKSGVSYAQESISVLNNLKGIQTLASSDTVRVTGNMEYGIILAPTVIIEGTIEKSMIIISENITISENAVIKEDLLCSAAKLELLGSIEGNLLGTIDKVDLNGNITKDFRANIGSITLNEDSKIQGNIYISSHNSIDISDKYPNAMVILVENTNDTFTFDIWEIIRLSMIFALLYLLISNKTNIIKNTLNKVKTYKKTTLLSGFASILLFPLIIIAFFILIAIGLGIITVPMVIIYGSFMISAFMLSTFIVGSVMSEYIMDKYSDKVKGNWYKLLLAFFLFLGLTIIVEIPTVGYTLSVALCILSVGIVITTIFRRLK